MNDSFDLVIVGMGSGGMTAAEFAAGLGVRVAVVERGRVGGDCLWTGCVPSKALLASAKAAHTMRHADRYGIGAVEPAIDTAVVWDRIRRIQQEIAVGEDDPDRYRAMGVEIIEGTAAVTGPTEVTVDGRRVLHTRFVLLCTGSRPMAPKIPGLEDAGYLTSENLFELSSVPSSMVMIGGGPIAMEMAQAFTRLGIRTTVLQKGPAILPKDEPALVEILQRNLLAEGLNLQLGVTTDRVTVEATGKTVHGTIGGSAQSWTAEEIFIAVGRAPNLEGLGLESVEITVGPRGIEVDDRMRTSTPSIYAAGDVAGRYLFTHSAGYEAVRAVRDMFFPGKGKADSSVPWCTFTDPELAHAGLTVEEAEARYGNEVQVWRQDLVHSDRARADSATSGAIMIVTATKKNRVVGAHILAPSAGEMIHELALAIREEISFSSLGALIHVYPTLSTGIYQLAGEAAFEKAESFRWLVKKGKR